MKKVLYIVIALGMVSTFAGAVEWMYLSAEDCNRYGKGTCHLGTDRCGCYGDERRAIKTCRMAGGRLPTINELKSVTRSCGVIAKEFGYNKLRHAYYNCMSNKRFGGLGHYRSRSRDKSGGYKSIKFSDASVRSLRRFAKRDFRCVK